MLYGSGKVAHMREADDTFSQPSLLPPGAPGLELGSPGLSSKLLYALNLLSGFLNFHPGSSWALFTMSFTHLGFVPLLLISSRVRRKDQAVRKNALFLPGSKDNGLDSSGWYKYQRFRFCSLFPVRGPPG